MGWNNCKNARTCGHSICFEKACKKYDPKERTEQTNADRLRAMSDEELADWLARTQIDNVAEALAIARIPFEQPCGMKDEVKKNALNGPNSLRSRSAMVRMWEPLINKGSADIGLPFGK